MASASTKSGSSPESVISKPHQRLLRTTAGVEPFAGTWNEITAAHLLHRTMFGPTRSEIHAAAASSLDTVVRQLLTTQPAPPIPPDPIEAGRDWTIGPYSDISSNNYKYIYALKQWWVGLMVTQGISITEKMTLFLHNHFATETQVVGDARYVYKQNALFRSYALGNLKELVKSITIDPAMLIYLNGYLNRIPTPDENYGRELQELFTIGKGAQAGQGDYTNYTEQDVKAAARVLTGWIIKRNSAPPVSVFVQDRHDPDNKQFSAAYQNTVITPKILTGGIVDGYQEVNDLVEMIFKQRATAECYCRKLYRYFVYYDIDATVEQNVITPLADIMIQNNFDLTPVLDTLFRSAHFFDSNNIGCVIKNPSEAVAGMIRQIGFPIPDTSSSDFMNLMDRFRSTFADLQMDLLDPPNVAGWAAYHQEPDYHEIWINTTTLPTRGKFTDSLLTGFTPSGGGTSYKLDPVAYAATLSNPSDPFALVDDLAADLMPPIQNGTYITTDQKNYLIYNVLGLVQNDEYEWTTNWNAAQQSVPDTAALKLVTDKLKSLLKFMMRMPEFQLT
jgi:uncharacterized protein (DUF1800 family)